MTTDVVVKVNGLSKTFGDSVVLKNINLTVSAGEVVVIMGPSGSGKTTLIRSLNFIEIPTLGTVEVCGISVECGTTNASKKTWKLSREDRRRMSEIRQNTAMVFQSFNLFPHMTVLQNVIEGLVSVKGIAKNAARQRGQSLLASVGMIEKANDYPGRLSGGQKQRVAIARGLAMDPKVIFFDEPTSALDPEVRDEVLGVMRDLARSGMTMLVVTHEVQFARDVADRVLFLEGGNVVQDSSSSDFFGDNNQSQRTRQFLGRLTV
jgi:cystine transport system ATP-binding protein